VPTIVVGYVPRAEGRAALDRAVEEARTHQARLVVVNSHRGDRDDVLDSEKDLAAVKAQLVESGVEHEVRQVVRGQDPAADLVEVADALDAEFIVIGLPRRSPVGKLILGSNAQRILLEAGCPVLAVKAG
jgi:nucleotide-binding universal stress UspA family protein